VSRPLSPREVEEAYDRFLDHAIDEELGRDDEASEEEEEPDWGSLVDDLGAALQLQGA